MGRRLTALAVSAFLLQVVAMVFPGTQIHLHSSQHLSINQNDQRLLEKAGAGILPKVQGPNIKIETPVKEATKINASPE